MNAKLRILNPKRYKCPNTEPFHIDRPSKMDGLKSNRRRDTCANHILIKVLILSL